MYIAKWQSHICMPSTHQSSVISTVGIKVGHSSVLTTTWQVPVGSSVGASVISIGVVVGFDVGSFVVGVAVGIGVGTPVGDSLGDSKTHPATSPPLQAKGHTSPYLQQPRKAPPQKL